MNKKTIAILAFLTLALAVPLTVFISRQRQEIRQRATGTGTQQVSLYFTRANSTSPLQQLAINPGEQAVLDLYLNAGNTVVNGFDITLSYQDGLSLTAVSERQGADRFNVSLFQFPNHHDPQNKTFHFAKVSSETGRVINGTLQLARLTFQTNHVVTSVSGTINHQSVTITSPTVQSVLTVNRDPLTYTIVQPSPSPTPTSPPTSPTPTGVTLSPTPTPHPADMDRNRCVGRADYDVWKERYTFGTTRQGTFPNCNGDNTIDLKDFNCWFNAMRTLRAENLCTP